MERYIYRTSDLIKNLTPYPIRAYSSSGGYIVLEPKCYSHTDVEEIVYIADDKGKERLGKTGVNIKRIFYASEKGIGRGGLEVQTLINYYDSRARLMPRGDS